MTIFILLAILASTAYLAQRNSKRFVIKSLIVALVLGVASILLFELLNGPHPECGVNDSVGPCGYADRIWYDSPFVFIPTFLFWSLILLTTAVGRFARKNLGQNKK